MIFFCAHLPLLPQYLALAPLTAYPPALTLSGLSCRFRPRFLAGLLVLLLFRVLDASLRSLPPSLSGPPLVPPAGPAPRRAPTSLRVVVAMPGGTRTRGKLGCCAKKKPRRLANSVAWSLSLGRREGLRPAARALRRRIRRLSSFLASFCSRSSRAIYRVGVERTVPTTDRAKEKRKLCVSHRCESAVCASNNTRNKPHPFSRRG